MADSLITEKQESHDRVFFNLIEKAGSDGRYQKITVVLWSTIAYICGGLMFMVPYLLYQDPYVCMQSYPEGCHKHVCSLSPEEREPFIPSPSMHTLGNQFGDYRCESVRMDLDFVASLLYLGNVIGFLGLTLAGGFTGRKNLMIISMFFLFVGLVITIFCANLIMAGIGLFLACIGVQCGFNICFYFISETISQAHRQKYSVLIQLFYGIGVTLNVAYYYLIGNWKIIMWVFYVAPTLFVAISVILLVVDTPMFLVTKQTALKALASFNHIAKLNQIQNLEITEQKIQSIQMHYFQNQQKQNKTNFTVLDLFKYKSQRMKTIFLMCMQGVIIVQFYAPSLMLDQFKLNIFIDGLVIGISELICYPICYFMIMKTKRKTTGYVCFIVAFICAFILIFLWKSDDQNTDIWSNVGVLIIIFIFRFFISVQYTFFYVYFNQVYPTQVRVLGTGLVSLTGGLCSTFAPILIDFCQNVGFPIMIIFAAMSLVSLGCQFKLPQTLHHPPADVIEQFMEQQTVFNPEDSQLEPNNDYGSINEILVKKGQSKSTNYSGSEPADD